MKKYVVPLLAVFIIACTPNTPNRTVRAKFPSYDNKFPPPVGQKDVFELSQNYPDTFNINEKLPWTNIDCKTNYQAYMKAVLAYCLEGNVEIDFKVQNNKTRKWYHAPWLDYGLNGREFYHGLTRERPVPPHELHDSQDVWLENWAIGFYNERGGYTIGKVWQNDSPNVNFAEFPEGTVSFKLLFTAGTTDKVPFLKGTKEWRANIYPCNPETGFPEERKACSSKRVDSVVRLLQIDIAIKDKQASETGWVFGTFIYDASQPGKTVWEKMVPVGLMWGDDSDIDTLINKEAAFINPRLKQTILNNELIEKKRMSYGDKAYMRHHGLGGRLNGPVDNPISSCISCHSKAAITDWGLPQPMANFKLTRKTYTISEFKKYFATVKGSSGRIQVDGNSYNKLDYSLQFSAGIRNFFQEAIDRQKTTESYAAPAASANEHNVEPSKTNIKDLPEVTRNGLMENK